MKHKLFYCTWAEATQYTVWQVSVNNYLAEDLSAEEAAKFIKEEAKKLAQGEVKQ